MRAQQESQTDQGVKSASSLEAERGLEAYEMGDFENAIKYLKRATKKRKDDPTPWHFLGLAYARQGDEKEAHKAMGSAVRLRLRRLTPGAVADSKKSYREWTTEEREAVRLRYAARYREALASVESYLQLNPPDADFWREQADSLKFYGQHSETPEATKTLFQSGDEGIVKAVVHSRPEPLYTEEARRNQATGTIVLRCVADAGGTVKHVLALRLLPYGLTEKAIAVARGIKFTPATKDGRPVSQIIMLEYNFNVF
jgi:tetratricopeptide (TPR) repeat protein